MTISRKILIIPITSVLLLFSCAKKQSPSKDWGEPTTTNKELRNKRFWEFINLEGEEVPGIHNSESNKWQVQYRQTHPEFISNGYYFVILMRDLWEDNPVYPPKDVNPKIKTKTEYLIEYKFGKLQNEEKIIRYFKYDKEGRLQEAKNYEKAKNDTRPSPGQPKYEEFKFEYSYDGEGNVIHVNCFSPYMEKVYEEIFEYNDKGLLVSITANITVDAGKTHDKNSFARFWTYHDIRYDIKHDLNTISLRYDSTNRLIEKVIWGPYGLLEEKRMYLYDTTGNITEMTVYSPYANKILRTEQALFKEHEIVINFIDSNDSVYQNVIYHYDGNYNLLYHKVFNKPVNIEWSKENIYNDKGMLIESKLLKTDSIMDWRIVNEFDKRNLLIQKFLYGPDNKVLAKYIASYTETGSLLTEQFLDEKNKLVEKYSYEYDTKSNVISKIKYDNVNEPVQMEKNVYEYY